MKQRFVGIAEMAVSEDPTEVLIAPNLGSCVAVAVFDPQARRGGLIHCLLPASRNDPEKAKANPCMYVDTGVALLIDTLLKSGCERKRLEIRAAGGANIADENGVFEIGKKNETVLRKILWKNNLLLRGEDFGGNQSRTVRLVMTDGAVWLKSQGLEKAL